LPVPHIACLADAGPTGPCSDPVDSPYSLY